MSGAWTDSGTIADSGELSYEINDSDWLRDAETGYWYYTKVLAPGGITEPLLRSFCLNGPAVNNRYSGRTGCITVSMEAVQAAALGASVWNKTNEDINIVYEERPASGDNSDSGVSFSGEKDGFRFGKDSDLFSSFKQLLPGQVVVQNISVENAGNKSTEIFLRAENGGSGSDELIGKLLTGYTKVTITVGGEQVYSGPLWQDGSGNGGEQLRRGGESGSDLYGQGICLGRFDAKSGTPITVELELSRDAGNEFSDLVGEVDWIFYARGSDNEPIPSTGDNDVSIWIIIMIVSAGSCIALITVRKIASSKSRKNKIAAVLIPVCLVAAITVPVLSIKGTLAFLSDSESESNDITPARLEAELTEPGFEPGTVLRPGQTLTKDPAVRNSGNIDMLCYLEVKIPVKTVRTVDPATKQIVAARETELFSFDADGAWILLEKTVENSGGNKYAAYFYGYAGGILAPGEVSQPLFTEMVYANILEGEVEGGSELDIPVAAFGIQNKYIDEGESLGNRLAYGYENLIKGA